MKQWSVFCICWQKNRIKEFRYVEPTLINLRSIRKYEAINFSVESWRIHHRTIVTIMDNLNMIYSVPNFALAISQRSLLVLYLYFWLSTSEISYMALASVNFIRTALIFYCFQILKNKVILVPKAVTSNREEFCLYFDITGNWVKKCRRRTIS